MFTGLIEEVARFVSLTHHQAGRQLRIRASQIAKEVALGDSLALNGCCLTVALASAEELTFDLLEETAIRTNLAHLREGSLVNVERALAFGGRLGGHMVQGHIDCTAAIISVEPRAADMCLEVALEKEATPYLVEKGSVALDGISLTVAEIKRESFVVWIVPHTREHTNLQAAQAGDLVNIEWDILAKYVERMLPAAIKGARGIGE